MTINYSTILLKILFNKDIQKMSLRQMAVAYAIQQDDTHNRLIHSLQVAENSGIMTNNISKQVGFNIDPQEIFKFAGLFHDIGHTAFAHLGEVTLNKMLRKYGITFDGNANNYVVLLKSKIMRMFPKEIQEYILASMAKHVNCFYPEQKNEKIIVLNEIAKEEIFLKENGMDVKLKKTLNCQIMDIADENCYLCSDIIDARSILTKKEMKKAINSICDRETANILVKKLYRSKAAFKEILSDYSVMFAENFKLENGKIVYIDKEIENIRIAFRKINVEYVLKNPKVKNIQTVNEEILETVFGYFIENEYLYSEVPSEYYKKKLFEEDLTEENRLILVRNMLGALTDKGVKKLYKKIKKKEIKNVSK